MKNIFKNRQILVTGGLGFIGSSLTIYLVKAGAKVTVVDNLTANQGGNLFNLAPVKDKVIINYSDIRDILAISQLVKNKAFIFHLARQTDHILSLNDPYPDIDVNIRGTTILLEACKKYNPRVRFVYIGTRGQYGPAVKIPVAETAPSNPRGIYEITNLAAEKIVQVYHSAHGINSVMLRLTNIYGPRSQMKHDHFGVVNWFVRLALDGKIIPVYGDGRLKRDFLYIDDTVGAILGCALTGKCYGEIVNIGRDDPLTFLDLVKTILKLTKTGKWRFAPFSKERLAQEPGDFASDITKINKLTGWRPKVSLDQGLKFTINYYKKYQKYYW